MQKVYSSLEELERFEEFYRVATKCGYRSCARMWKENKFIQGSVNPSDFGLSPRQ